MISKRGKPETGDDRSDTVHFQTVDHWKLGLPHTIRTACGTGNFHVYVSQNINEVTCERCRAKRRRVTGPRGRAQT